MRQDEIWQAVLGELELSMSRGNFVTWFKNTCLLKQADATVVIGVTNVFMIGHMQKRYTKLIIDLLAKNGIKVNRVEYTGISKAIKQRAGANPSPKTGAAGPAQVEAVPRTTATAGPGQKPGNTVLGSGLAHSYRQGLNARYTLDSFVVGGSNEVAFAACQGIVRQPGSNRYNPLFLYGGVGIGKTHLIQAAGNALAARDPGAKVLYISMEQFVQEFVDALRFRKTAAFARHYRTADVLIVDDIQFIAGKEKTQEEFFHTFNALHQANKQIIISADKPPKDIPTLEDRLASRFNGGMSIDMQIPDFETRCAIIQTKAQAQDSELENDIVEYLATNINTNIRELEGALNQLLAHCAVQHTEPSLALAASLVAAHKTRPKHLSAKQVVERTARHFHVPLDDILGPKRDKDIVVPRQVAMYILREELKLSYPKIAHELGRKDHTTAIHSVDKIIRECRSDAGLRLAIADIKEHLYV